MCNLCSEFDANTSQWINIVRNYAHVSTNSIKWSWYCFENPRWSANYRSSHRHRFPSCQKYLHLALTNVQHNVIMPDNGRQMFSCLHVTFQQALCHNIIIIIRTGMEFSNLCLTQHLMSMIMMEPSSQFPTIIQVFSLQAGQALRQVPWSPPGGSQQGFPRNGHTEIPVILVNVSPNSAMRQQLSSTTTSMPLDSKF